MFPNAYFLEVVHTASSFIGVCVNAFTWLAAKDNLRYAERAQPYDGDRISAGKNMVRRERVSLVYVQGLMLALGLLSLFYPPPPWPWDLQGIPLPWRELTPVQRGAVFYAWLWRLGISAMCLRKAINSIQNWWEERPLRRPLRPGQSLAEQAQEVASGAQVVATAAQRVATSAQADASAALSAQEQERKS